MKTLFAIVLVIPIILFIIPLFFVLRSEIVYWSLLLASLLFPWIAYEIVQNNLGEYNVEWFVVSISTTTVLGLYKLFDWIILKLFGRHVRLFWQRREFPKNAEWIDLIMKVILISLPIIWFWIGRTIFK